MNQIIEAAFSRAGAVLVAMVMLFGVGVSSYFSIPKEAKPDIDIRKRNTTVLIIFSCIIRKLYLN